MNNIAQEVDLDNHQNTIHQTDHKTYLENTPLDNK